MASPYGLPLWPPLMASPYGLPLWPPSWSPHPLFPPYRLPTMKAIMHFNIEKPENPPTAFPVFPQLSEPAFSQLKAEAKRLGVDDSPPHQDFSYRSGLLLAIPPYR